MGNFSRYFENRDCEFYPCHSGLDDLNCLFCFCPLYSIIDCPGNPDFKEKNGQYIKVCTNCDFPHRRENYDRIILMLSKNKNVDKE